MDRLHPPRLRTAGGSASSSPTARGERVLTTGPGDEGPSWAPSSRELVFQRTDAAGAPGLYRVTLDGSAPRRMTIPQDGSDPDWSGVMDWMRKILRLYSPVLVGASAAAAQLPVPAEARPPQPQQPVLTGIDALRADFAAQSGGTTVYFGAHSVGSPCRRARCWRRRRRGCVAIPESWCGSKAMAIRATRAIMRWRSAPAAPRRCAAYLVLLGVPAAQVATTSWGKERPGARPRRDNAGALT